MIRRLSASKLERAFECPASAVLPVIDEAPGAGAQKGTFVHTYLETVALEVKAGALLEAAGQAALILIPPQHREFCEIIDLKRLPLGGQFRQEVGVAYNFRTGVVRHLGDGLSHDSVVAGPDEITGIADVLEDTGTSIFVGDFKTGFSVVPPAARNRQLKFLAFAFCKLFGRQSASVAIIKLRDSGTPYFDSAEIDDLALAAFEVELREVVDRAEKQEYDYEHQKPLSYKKGPHCDYCPSFNYCEAQTAVIRQLAVAPATLESVIADQLTSGNASEAYAKFKEAEHVMKRIRAAFYSWAGQNPIALADGKVFGRLVYPKDVFTEDAAVVLTDLVGSDAASAFKITKKGLKEVARKVVERKKQAGVKTTLRDTNQEILDALAREQALVQEMKTKLCEHTPGEVPEDDE